MTMRKYSVLICLLLSISLCGCGVADKQAMLKKARHAKTKADLEAALGKPDKFEKAKLGVSFESWRYTATDGEVEFGIVNDKVITVGTVPKKREKEQKQ